MISITSTRSSVGNAGRFLDDHGGEQHALVQHTIVLTNCVRRQRHALGPDARNTAVPASCLHRLTAVSISPLPAGATGRRPFDQPDAAAPGQHQERDDAGEQQRNQPPSRNLVEFAAKNTQSMMRRSRSPRSR